MTPDALDILLNAVARGETPPADALAQLQGFRQLPFATLDTGRARRRGAPEIIYGLGKTPAQIVGLAKAMVAAGQRVLVTRIAPAAAAAVIDAVGSETLSHDPVARCLLITADPQPAAGAGPILVICAGTSDLAVAKEAAFVARALGEQVIERVDVGVAGLHRLLAHIDVLRQAAVIIAVAGMEGALPSVIAGLVDRPVIAVPTSVGYGANLGGVTALLAMVNSCAAGVTVVNVDNGFGAAYAAWQMNRPFEAQDG